MAGPDFRGQGNVLADGVGIGTPSPGRRLHVYEDQHVLGYGYPALFAVDPIGIGNAYVTIQSSSQAYLWLNTTGGGLSWVVGSEFDGATNIFRISSVATGFVGDRIARLVINQNGNVGIGTPTPASRLHMKTKDAGYWSPLIIEAESDWDGVHSSNAIFFRRSRSSGLPAQDTDDCGVLRFEYMRPRDWGVSAWIDSRIVDVSLPGKEEGRGELTFVVMMEDGPKERMRIHHNGFVTIGDPDPQYGNPPLSNLSVVSRFEDTFIEARAGIGRSSQFRLFVRDAVLGDVQQWAMHCQPGDTTLYWYQGATGGNKMKLDAAGNLYIKGSYQQFSPAPPKATMSPDDFLDWALEDAVKPAYPGDRLPEDPVETEKYRKDISKIAIGTARYVEHLREQIKMLEARLARLEGAEGGRQAPY